MDQNELSFRIKAISAVRTGFTKSLSALKSWTQKASQIVRSAFRKSPEIRRVKTKAAENNIRRFANKSLSIVKTAFSKINSLGINLARNLARSIARGVKWAIISLTGLGIWSVKTASDVEEMEYKFNIVFGKFASQAKKWAKNFGDAVNRSKYTIMEYMSSLQDLFVPMGFTRDKAAELSKGFSKLAVDLASFNNTTDDVALEKIKSALTGMYRPLREFGVLLTDEKVKLKAFQMGLSETKKEASDQAMTLARLVLIQEMSNDAMNDATRTAGSFANRLKGLRARFKDWRTEVGKQIIEGAGLRNVLDSLTKKVATFIKHIRETQVVARFSSFIRKSFGAISTRIKNTTEAVKEFFKYLTSSKDITFSGLKTELKSIFEGLKEDWKALTEAKTWEKVSNIFDKIAENFGKIAAKVIIQTIKELWNLTGGKVIESAKKKFKETSSSIAKKTWEAVKTPVKEHPIASTVTAVGAGKLGALLGLGKLFKGIGDQLYKTMGKIGGESSKATFDPTREVPKGFSSWKEIAKIYQQYQRKFDTWISTERGKIKGAKPVFDKEDKFLYEALHTKSHRKFAFGPDMPSGVSGLGTSLLLGHLIETFVAQTKAMTAKQEEFFSEIDVLTQQRRAGGTTEELKALRKEINTLLRMGEIGNIIAKDVMSQEGKTNSELIAELKLLNKKTQTEAMTPQEEVFSGLDLFFKRGGTTEELRDLRKERNKLLKTGEIGNIIEKDVMSQEGKTNSELINQLKLLNEKLDKAVGEVGAQ